MGEIADSLIDGEMDFYTGEYLGKGVGYPRTHNGSLPWEKKKSYPLGGVLNFLRLRGLPVGKSNKVVKRYGREVLKIETPTAPPDQYYKVVMPVMREIGIEIQKDFQAFKKWYNENYPATPKTSNWN